MQVIGHDAVSLGGWEPVTGKRLWTLLPEKPNDFNVPTPIALDDKLLVSTENNGTRLYEFDDNGLLKPKPVAVNRKLAPDTHTPIVPRPLPHRRRVLLWTLLGSGALLVGVGIRWAMHKGTGQSDEKEDTKPDGPIGIGTALAVSETNESGSPSERWFTRLVPSSTGPPRSTTQAGLNTAMWSRLAANEPQDSISQEPRLPISASSTLYAPPSLAAKA